MTFTPTRSAILLLLWLPAIALAQAPDFAPLKNSWPTYSGDYSGQRFSSLTQINTSNVKSMTLAWTARLAGGPTTDAGGGLGPAPPPTIVGGEIAEAVVTGGLFGSADRKSVV